MKQLPGRSQLPALDSPEESSRRLSPATAGALRDAPEIDIRWIWMVILRRKWLILGVTISVLLPTAIVTYLATPLYRSTVTLKIAPEAVKVLPYAEIREALVSPAKDYERYLNSQQEILRSRALIGRTVRRIKQDPEVSEFQGGGLSGLELQPVPLSHMLNVSYSSPDPQLAAKVANTIAEEFIQMSFEQGAETTQRAARFLEEQLEVTREKVEDAEAELIKYAREHDILNYDNDQKDLIRQKLDQLTVEVTRLETEQLNKRAQLEMLDELSANNLPESYKTATIRTLEGSLITLRQELTQLESRFGESWPEVTQTKLEIDRVTRDLEVEIESAIARLRKEAKLEFEASQKEYQMISNAIKTQEQMVNNLNNASIQLNILKREVSTNEELYQGLLQKLKETGVTAGLEFGNFHIISPAEPASTPYSPDFTRNLTIAALLGISLGLGLAFVLDILDNTVKAPEDLEPLRITSLGLVPVIEGLNGRFVELDALFSAEDKRIKAVSPSGLLAPGQWQARESYYGLATAILLSKAEEPPKKILVTSATPQDGKTTTVAYLGATLADMGASTVIVDADLRKPSLGDYFGIETDWGLSNFLAGHSGLRLDYLHETAVPGLSILPAGPKTPNPIALFSSTRFRDLLEALRRVFNFVLVDTSPILTVADTRMLVASVEGVVMVVQAGKTPKEIVKRAREELEQSGACILGAVINRADLKQPQYAYYNRYYYHEGYSHLPSKTAT